METLPTADLLVLRIQGSAPSPGSLTFYVSNARPTVRRLVHNDGFNTLYVEVAFPSGALASLSGTPLGAADSAQVTLSPRSGQYGVTLSPAALTFVSGREPEATFSYAVYGDASVADGSATYAMRLDYLRALRLWHEISPGLWQRVSGSGAGGTDEVRGLLREHGTFVVAAPR